MLKSEMQEHLRRLIEIGTSLSVEKDPNRLLERILEAARGFTGADGGTLYTMDGQSLRFQIVITKSLNIHMGGTSGQEITWPPVPLYADGRPNRAQVSAYAALTGEVVNLADVYEADGFDFAGTRRFDASTGYRSRSMLVIPMQNHEGEVIGVLQLLNAIDERTGQVTAFTAADQEMVSALASQAAVAITNQNLIRDLQRLFEAFVGVVAATLDEQSPATAGHIHRVTELTMALAKAVNHTQNGPYAGVRFNDEELYELRIAALLHDIGKITTPIHIVEKGPKLQAIFDRIELVRTRFQLIKKTAEAECLEKQLHLARRGADAATLAAVDRERQERLQALDEDLAFLEALNVPREFTAPELIERARAIGARTYTVDGVERPYLTDDELGNLCIQRGNITRDELERMRDHARVGIKLLEQIPFTRTLQDVPSIAGAHHEKLNGKGYPLGLTAEQIGLKSRILAVADVYEALTAADRSYKRPRTHEEALRILGFMVKDGELDRDLVDLFVQAGVYKLISPPESPS